MNKISLITEAAVRRALMPDVPVFVELLGARVRKYFKKERATVEGTIASYE